MFHTTYVGDVNLPDIPVVMSDPMLQQIAVPNYLNGCANVGLGVVVMPQGKAWAISI